MGISVIAKHILSIINYCTVKIENMEFKMLNLNTNNMNILNDIWNVLYCDKPPTIIHILNTQLPLICDYLQSLKQNFTNDFNQITLQFSKFYIYAVFCVLFLVTKKSFFCV